MFCHDILFRSDLALSNRPAELETVMDNLPSDANKPLPCSLSSSSKFVGAKPLLLCLHGRGSNAKILQFQTRLITARLASTFEFIFLDGPFLSDAGPGILPWFEGMGPYYNWGTPSIGSSIPSSTSLSTTSQREIDEEERREMTEVNKALNMVMEGDQASRVVGVLGFSQGTRVVSGLLRRQQIFEEAGIETETAAQSKLNGGKNRASIKFGILVCGGGGLSFRPFNLIPPENQVRIDNPQDTGFNSMKIRIPTLHVHGTQDKIVQKGKELVETWFDENNARVLDVEAGHHFPREQDDVAAVCRNILELWETSRASWESGELGRSES